MRTRVAKIVVLGAGVCGLAAGMLLARDRHDVTVLERDPAPAPDTVGEAWEHWTRGGVAQFRQPHYLQPRARHVLDAELTDVRDALVTAGALFKGPGFADRVLEVAARHAIALPPGPTREELLRLIA